MPNMPSVDRIYRNVRPNRELDARVLKTFRDPGGSVTGAYINALEWAVKGVPLSREDYRRIGSERKIALERRNNGKKRSN